MKEDVQIMKKKLILLVTIILTISTGCDFNGKSNNDTMILNSKDYVRQLREIKIKGTNDYFIITEKRSFDFEPDSDNETEGDMVSWAISIPYRMHVNNIDYEGYCNLGDEIFCSDDNDKYNIVISNLKKEKDDYYAEVLITKK